MALTAEEFEGQSVKSLKTLVAKQIGVPRFRQRWLSEDHTELGEKAFVIPSDVQLVVLDFVEVEDGDVEKLRDACQRNLSEEVEELPRKPMNPKMTFDGVQGDPLLTRSAHGRTALHVAAEFGNQEVVSLLLEAGADKDAANSLRMTGLQIAADEGHLKVVQLLLESGADKDAAGFEGKTALHSAASNGQLEVVSLLLEVGADKDMAAAASNGKTALHFSVRAKDRTSERLPFTMPGHKEVVRLLLEFGVDKDAADFDGMTALHWAAENGDNEVVQLLLQFGADKDVATSRGRKSALHLAAFEGHLEVVRLLLEAGADKDATDFQGKTALQLATNYGHQEVVQLLEAQSES